jgi:hypothetical protein
MHMLSKHLGDKSDGKEMPTGPWKAGHLCCVTRICGGTESLA